MSAGATQSQKNHAKHHLYRKLRTLALAHGIDHIRPYAQGPILTDREGWQYRFAMTFSNASNGQTFGQTTVTVCPPAWRGKPSATFNSWSWTGSKGNQSLAEFWRQLSRRGGKAELRIGDLRDAYAKDVL